MIKYCALFFLFGCSILGERSPASLDYNILVIGDSHMAGPFGQYLHQSLATRQNTNVITYGHASSAAVHWLSQKRHSLSGGVYHFLSAHKTIHPNELVRMANPNPTDWRVAVEVPLFEPLVLDMNMHEQWREKGFPTRSPDLVVIELGANDRGHVYQAGQINRRGFEQRKNYARRLADLATSSGAKCLWIGPPHGRVKTDAEQAALYQMLGEALENTECELISSNHFKAMGCDGVHFNCREEMDNARKWSVMAYDKIKELINQ